MLFFLQDQWQLVVGLALLLIGATEIGYRIGARNRGRIDEPSRARISAMEGAILGLLALLIGFTFAMTVSRYDLRKQLVLDEANAIGTTFLRARFLPEAGSSGARDLLRRYVDARLDFYRAGGNQERLEAALQQSKRLQDELWKLGSAAARDDTRSVPLGLFLQSLNETIDLDAKRRAAMENHVPETVWGLLLIVAVLGTLTVGYGSGLGGQRVGLPMFVTPLLLAAVITLLIDMDRPRRGLIRISQESVIRLKSDLVEEGTSR